MSNKFLKINTEKLENLIHAEFKDMRMMRSIEETGFAILECNGIQVQVTLTRNDYDFHSKVQDGVVELI